MGLRQQKLADAIKELLASFIQSQNVADPRLEIVTITQVKMTKDLQLASIYFRVYDDTTKDTALAGLESCKGHLRHHLGKELTIRRVPNLRFFYDDSLERWSEIDDLLKKV